MNPQLSKHLEQQLSGVFQQAIKILNWQAVSGGCINQAYKLSCDSGITVFIKLNSASLLDMFRAEQQGLKILAKTHSIIVPKPILLGSFEQQSYLILEHLDISSHFDEVDFARQLGLLHSNHNSQFGFEINNYIGSSPQSNKWHEDWFDFFIEQRLEKQHSMLSRQCPSASIDRLWPTFIQACTDLFASHKPIAAILHGDLWQGNIGSVTGQSCIFDPAVYYGDHETDLAMLEVFGNPSNRFYQAYQEVMPIQPGFEQRKVFYNLYHILNHANLFGPSYSTQALAMMKQIVQWSNA